MTRKIQKFAYNYHAYIDLMLYHEHYSTVRPRRGCIQALPISNPLTSIYMLILLSPCLIICIECMYVYRYVMKFLINKKEFLKRTSVHLAKSIMKLKY